MDPKQPSPIDVLIGARMRMRREELDITQPVLAERLGVTFQQLQKYETGRNRIAAGRLYLAAAVLEASLQYFFKGAGELSAASARRGVAEDQAAFEHAPNAEAVEMLVNFTAIKDADKRRDLLAAARKSAGRRGRS